MPRKGSIKQCVPALVVLLLLALLASCGSEPPDRPKVITIDASSRQLDGRPPPLPDTRPDLYPQPYCGDHICQDPETLISCPRDCRPQPYHYEFRLGPPDPGYIDPPRSSAQMR